MIGDQPEERGLGLFSDADFAGARVDMRCTSGVFRALCGTHRFSPLVGQSKKQTARSHNTVEADIVAADHALRTSGLPALQSIVGAITESPIVPGSLSGQSGHGQNHDD